MLSLDDQRWRELEGGYRTPFDPRPLLSSLARGEDTRSTWDALWEGLHHQGDVGEASYAAVPHLVRIYRERGQIDWNTFAIVATIELARPEEGNPSLPAWLAEDYLGAIRDLGEIGIRQLSQTADHDVIRSILAVIAIRSGLREHGRILVGYSDEEAADLHHT